MVDFVVEVLEEGVAYKEIDFSKHRHTDKPKCDKICLLSGQKAFNEFHNIVQVSAKTLVRVWLH